MDQVGLLGTDPDHAPERLQRDLAHVVAVKDGTARVIVRGETEEDLLARDMGVIRKAQ